MNSVVVKTKSLPSKSMLRTILKNVKSELVQKMQSIRAMPSKFLLSSYEDSDAPHNRQPAQVKSIAAKVFKHREDFYP